MMVQSHTSNYFKQLFEHGLAAYPDRALDCVIDALDASALLHLAASSIALISKVEQLLLARALELFGYSEVFALLLEVSKAARAPLCQCRHRGGKSCSSEAKMCPGLGKDVHAPCEDARTELLQLPPGLGEPGLRPKSNVAAKT